MTAEESRAESFAPTASRSTRHRGPPRALRPFLILLVVSFAVAAILAVVALTAGDLGDLEVRILLTSVALGAFALTGLASSVRLARGSFRAVGVAGIVASAGALALFSLAVWTEEAPEALLRGTGGAAIVAAGLAHASLVLLTPRGRPSARAAVIVALVAAAAAALLLLASVSGLVALGSMGRRVAGALGIVALFGTAAGPALSVSGR
jgi:hypothetical protein